MASRKPSQLPFPALSDYPIISIIFAEKVTGFVAHDGNVKFAEVGLRSKIASEQFNWPSEIQVNRLAPLEAMTEETFERMSSILKIKCEDWPIDRKVDLELYSQKRSQYVVAQENGRDPFTRDQLEAYFLSKASFAQNIHWGQLASLYNESEPDQKEAIFEYFDKYHGLELEKLLSYKAQTVLIPGSVCEEYQTRDHNGETYLFSDGKGKWLRNDRFYQQYRIDITIENSHASYLLASAATLKEAVVKATLFVQAYEGFVDNCGRLEIYQSGVPIIHAEILEIAPSGAEKHSGKLRWDFENIGPDQKHIEGMKRYCKLATNDNDNKPEVQALEADITRLDALISATAPIEKARLLSTVLDVEKALGLQWNKVYRLENDLGL